MYYNCCTIGDLIDYHCFLSLDSSPAVRQNAANNLVDFSEVVHMSIFDSKLTPRLEQFSFDQNVILLNVYKNLN